MSLDQSRGLPLGCPRCNHGVAQLYIASATILTVTCGRCRHAWSIEIDTLPRTLRALVAAAVLAEGPA